MNNVSATLTDIAARALEASRHAQTALEADVLPNSQGNLHDLSEELTDAIISRDIFTGHVVGLIEQVLDDLAEHILEGSTRSTRYDVHSVSGGSWTETTRTEQAKAFARANAVLLDFQHSLCAVLDRVEAERAVVRLLAVG
ncbi:hypothetical protein DSM110093_03135 [Sulfitobacter sp. DSM 110093]|uniref:hypothetical protein n=1 Tax=Sulfitobacter sp. DSM 110093 TaxID=2883127 RepID=UPI001FAC1A33|nr:hypothetical protein [Sulfitobacter sp. DSM 110093]UOA33310.1 hypothetical protein DSM110093_03135 [Sulfitobacter sp. DSM 110093]